jgi:hypothetical protein
MEQMDAAAVAAWFSDELELPQYAAAANEHEVDGDMLLDLVEWDKLAALEGEPRECSEQTRYFIMML